MFIARHTDGPLQGEDVSLAAPHTPARLWYAPAPEGVPAPFPVSGYMLVGYEQEPEAPWPGQVEYVLNRERSDLRPHQQWEEMEQGVAVYELRPMT